ncbi:hypothetical protein CU097_002861 [Rhizopus azygosporus]|uniref:Methionyl-tRNA formyltransferase, mitochondrial n=1 Tax=Rhizopus azygosporus TaxID=86630 RepID=A0A367IXA8_RHIAZ|nr:hypothetical protein CU097_002861 [Rhizopus azygosporus]
MLLLKTNRLFGQLVLSRHYSTSNKLKLLFFGTDDFASLHLKALIKEKKNDNSCIESLELVCPPDRFTGRKLETLTPSETKGVAELYNIPVHHTPLQAKTLNDWHLPKDQQYDLGVAVSFGYFIPPHIISQFRFGAINVHPSLLPKYRGAAPIQHAIINGDHETGVTVQELDDKEFDAGRILAQERVSLSDKVPFYSTLRKTLGTLGSNLLVDTIQHIHERKASARNQDVSQATKAPKIKKEWSEVDFENMTAWKVEQLSRAIGEQYPLRTTYTKKKKRKLRTYTVQLMHLFVPAHPCPLLKGLEPGEWVWHEQSKSIHILFKDGSVIACPTVKLEGRDAIAAKDFVNGFEHEGIFGVTRLYDEVARKKTLKLLANMKEYTKIE